MAGVKPWSLVATIDKVLESPALAIILRGPGLAVTGFSKPKQTGTTNRWKVALAVEGHGQAVRTKIEFSSRGEDPRFALGVVPERVVKAYALRAPRVQHYLLEAAIEQKVSALAGRSETQARDVFDLDHLLRRHPVEAVDIPAELRGGAIERALALPWEAFEDQVLPFIEPEAAELLDASAWDQMQLHVVETLGSGQ